MFKTLPMILTLSRIVAIPVLVALFYAITIVRMGG